MEKRVVKVSDHAVIRYIERVHGVDVDSIRAQMAKALKKEIMNFAGGNDISVTTNECKFVIKDGVIITCIL